MNKFCDNPNSNNTDDKSNKNIFWIKETIVFIVALIIIATVLTIYIAPLKS